MRLLERKGDGDYSLIHDIFNNLPPYAILSHTWSENSEEMSFIDLSHNTARNKDGYNKIRFCGDQAAKEGLRFFWVDTCCIDKSNNTELTEAINWHVSMIDVSALRGESLSNFSVEKRMLWTANQNTTRKEDETYCLLGILSVHMPLIYGEGDNAFARLNEVIRKRSEGQGQIIEAANSALDITWVIRKIGVSGKNGSAIAAAVSRPNFRLIHILYLDVNNYIHDATYTPSTDIWRSGALSDRGYTAIPNSSLTVMYNQCRLCANTTIIAFQDKNGSSLDPAIGTGLALQPFYRGGLEDQINLYYQKSDLSMGLASWKPAIINNRVDGWSLNEQILGTIPSGSPIAAASSYSNVSTGYETWIEVLCLSSQGIQVNTWSGTQENWLQIMHPSVMANLTSSQKSYGDVAVTATGNAFGVVMQDGQADAIENWLVEDDLLDWNSIGIVNLGGAWG
ncbi:MAG: hypothetical protein Q9167_007104 [Letrouitia subvulpina]